MKRITFLALALGLSTIAYSQINWVKDMNVAQGAALNDNKFIVMDFWAIWCGPCKKMDKEMWDTERMTAYKDKFIFLKVDVDRNSTIAMNYQANSIPKVVIIDPAGKVVWEQVGFSNSKPYFDVLESFPSTPLPSNDFTSIRQDKNVESASLNVGVWYQNTAIEIEDPMIARKFFYLSDSYLKEAAKSKNEPIAQEAELNMVLNYAYSGKTKKALKKVEKMDDTEMKNFIIAYCYKCEGQEDLMKKFAERVQSKDLLARLDK